MNTTIPDLSDSLHLCDDELIWIVMAAVTVYSLLMMDNLPHLIQSLVITLFSVELSFDGRRRQVLSRAVGYSRLLGESQTLFRRNHPLPLYVSSLVVWEMSACLPPRAEACPMPQTSRAVGAAAHCDRAVGSRDRGLQLGRPGASE